MGVHHCNQFLGIFGICGVTFVLKPMGSFVAAWSVVAAFPVFIVFVPTADEIANSGLNIGEVEKAVADCDPVAVDELLGGGQGSIALDAEEVVAT